MFGSTIIAFHIFEIDRIFRAISAFDFESLITDVAEAITYCLKRSQFLASYAGNGTFVCVYGSGDKQNPEAFELELRDVIESMELCYSDGRPLIFTVVASTPVRLTFRSGQYISNALLQACSTVETRGLTSTG